MLKITLATVAFLAIASTAQADEVSEICGEKLTWQGAKCAFALGLAQNHERQAKRLAREAQHAELDGRADMAEHLRNKAAYEAAAGKRVRANVLSTYAHQAK
jgi:hypothetical protein